MCLKFQIYIFDWYKNWKYIEKGIQIEQTLKTQYADKCLHYQVLAREQKQNHNFTYV